MSAEQIATIVVAALVGGLHAWKPQMAPQILASVGVGVTVVGTLFVHSIKGQRLVEVVAHALEEKTKQ